ncbi:MAG: LytR C-terminal domain-containing protein [Actinomycetia bacterium]|nr:LytR C-terminal domain-containing protein [Actinomycetes bacterium]
MLTPLGAGASASRRRRWPRVLAVLLVLGLLAGAAYGAWWWFGNRADEDATPNTAPSKVCTTPTAKPPRNLPAPAEVTVAVGNGTDLPGLAVQTADALAVRGFVVTSIGNADKPVKQGVAQVRYIKTDIASAVVVASYVPGAELAEVSRTPDVALWLGPQFDGLVKTSEADTGAVELPALEPVCTKNTKITKKKR